MPIEKMIDQVLADSRNATDNIWKAQTEAYKLKSNLLIEVHEKIKQRHEDFNNIFKDMGAPSGCSENDTLKINAGGEIVSTSRGILTQIKGSRLEALFSGRWDKYLQPNNDGCIYLDVNSSHFKAIVQCLESKKKAQGNDASYTLPVVREDETLFLENLFHKFGLEKVCNMSPMNRSKILKDMDLTHTTAFLQFLNEDNIQGYLKLLYRASTDGWESSKFHEKCDNQGETVTLIRSTGGYVFGGYTEKSWKSSGFYLESPKAFLFSLKCHSGLGPTKMRQKTDHAHYAVGHHSTYGPTFGIGHDICVAKNGNSGGSYTDVGHTYNCPPGQTGDTFLTGSSSFRAEEIEVFTIVPYGYPCLPSEAKVVGSNIKSQEQPREQNLKRCMDELSWCKMTFDEFPDNLKEAMENEQKELISSWDELVELEERLEKEMIFVNSFTVGQDIYKLISMYREGISMYREGKINSSKVPM